MLKTTINHFITTHFKSIQLHYSWLFALSFILGIAWSKYPSLLGFYAVLTTAVAVGLYAAYQNTLSLKHLLFYCLSFLCFFGGIFLVLKHEKAHSNFLAQTKAITSYEGTIIDIENWIESKSVLTFAINKPLSGLIKIYVKKNLELEVGDVIALKNLTLLPTQDKRYAFYLKKEGISASAFVWNLDYTLLHRPTYHVWRFFNQQKHRIIKSFLTKMNELSGVLFCSIFLGTKHPNENLLQSVKAQFNNWGLLHLLARSGLHLSCIAFLIFLLLRLIPLHIFAKKILILSVLTLYSLLTFTTVSFARAFITNALYTLFIITDKAIHPMHIFVITTVMVLLNNPYHLFFLDFQLSFGITFLILLFSQSRQL